MQPNGMTQQQAVERAWRAAADAEGKAHLGDPAAAHALAAVAEAWARVAGQLPLDECPRPAAHMPAELDGSWPPGQIAVPVPRPLRVTDEQLVDEPDLGARIAAERLAAADALRGVDPLDPRVPVADVEQTLVLDAPQAHEPLDYGAEEGSGICRGCAQPIEWRGGVWIDVVGRGVCVAR